MIDGFELKASSFNKQIFNISEEELNESGKFFNFNYYLYSCITDYEKLSYNYFESVEYSNFKIKNDEILNKDTIIDILTFNKIFEKIYDLETKLRIIFNIPILFEIIYFKIYDENKKNLFNVQVINKMSIYNRLKYELDEDEFSNNSRLHLDFKFMKNIKNLQFKRALEFYNDSFESDNVRSRFILIFTSLEAIFNLDGKSISEKLSECISVLLSQNNEQEKEQIKKDIKYLYSQRSKYVHGKMNVIQKEDEKLLRFYTRKIILIYWFILYDTNLSSKNILEYIYNKKNFNLRVRLFISAINSNNFDEQQYNCINIIENNFGFNISKKIKEKTYTKYENYK